MPDYVVNNTTTYTDINGQTYTIQYHPAVPITSGSTGTISWNTNANYFYMPYNPVISTPTIMKPKSKLKGIALVYLDFNRDRGNLENILFNLGCYHYRLDDSYVLFLLDNSYVNFVQMNIKSLDNKSKITFSLKIPDGMDKETWFDKYRKIYDQEFEALKSQGFVVNFRATSLTFDHIDIE